MLVPVKILKETTFPEEAAQAKAACEALLTLLAPSIEAATHISIGSMMEITIIEVSAGRGVINYQVAFARFDNAPPIPASVLAALEPSAMRRLLRNEAPPMPANQRRPVAGNNLGRSAYSGAARKWSRGYGYR